MKHVVLVVFAALTATPALQSPAQIVYTDIPDTTVIAPEVQIWAAYDVDLNRDGATDFFIIHHNTRVSADYAKIEVQSAASGAEILCDGTPGNYPYALLFGESIDASRTDWLYNGSFTVHMNENGQYGHWIGVTDRCLGVRVSVAGEWRYGWIRLDVPADAGSFTLKDWAYSSAAGIGIAAGDKGTTGIAASVPSPRKLCVYPNPATDAVTITLPADAAEGVDIAVADLLGRRVPARVMREGSTGVVRLPRLAPGCYLVLVTTRAATQAVRFAVR